MPATKLMPPMHQHQHEEAGRAERAVRRDDRRKEGGFGDCCRCRALMPPQYRAIMAQQDHQTRAQAPPSALSKARAARPPSQAGKAQAKADRKAAHGATAAMDHGRDRGSVPPLSSRQSGRRAASLSTSIRSRCWSPWCCPRRRPMPASTRRRRRCSRSPTRRRRWSSSAKRGARADQDHRPVPHQGEERHRAVAQADRRARRQGAARRARRSKRCPASAARPPTSCSISPSASRPSRSTPTSSASATAPGSPSARRRSTVEMKLMEVVPERYRCTPITGSSCTAATSASRAGRCARNA